MGFKVTVRAKDLKFDKYAGRAEREILNALNVIAAEVQAHARSGHPKVSPETLRRLARNGQPQGPSLDRLRERTGAEAGEYKGMLRFLTRTGVTRNSIFIQKAKAEGTGFSRQLSAKVYTAQQHAVDLEFGTVSRRAFPFLRPALAAKISRGNALIRAALGKAEGGL